MHAAESVSDLERSLLFSSFLASLAPFRLFFLSLDTNYTIVVYLVFSAADAFNQLLYSSPLFERANEVHLRLGLIYKALEDFQLAIKVRVIESIFRFECYYFLLILFLL